MASNAVSVRMTIFMCPSQSGCPMQSPYQEGSHRSMALSLSSPQAKADISSEHEGWYGWSLVGNKRP